MKYLIDTQILIWYQLDISKISKSNMGLLTDISNEILISQVTLFEIAINQKIGKLPELDVPVNQLVNLIKQDGFEILPIKNVYIAGYEQIPLMPDHRDPYDRLIIATAFSENLRIISADEKFKYYQSSINLIAN